LIASCVAAFLYFNRAPEIAGGRMSGGGGGDGARPVDPDELRQRWANRFVEPSAEPIEKPIEKPIQDSVRPPADASKESKKKSSEAAERRSVSAQSDSKAKPATPKDPKSSLTVSKSQGVSPPKPASPKDPKSSLADRRVLSQSQGVSPSQVADEPVLSKSSDGSEAASIEHLFFLDLFRIVLDKTQQVHFPNHLLLPLLGAEIAKSSGSGKLLSAKYARSVLLEAKSLLGLLPFMSYLLQCFSRLKDLSRNARNAQYVASVQSLLVSQAAFAAQESLVVSHGRDDIVLALLQEPPEDALHSLRQFVRALAAHVHDQGGDDLLDKLFGGSLSGAHYFMGRLELLDEFHLPFKVLQYLLDDPLIAKLAVHRSNWLPNKLIGRDLETSSLLGLFFRPSTCSETVYRVLFPENGSNENDRENIVVGRNRLDRLHSMQMVICRSLLRSPEGRSKLLLWLKAVAGCNKIKTRTLFDPSIVSSTGFLLNCSFVASALFLELGGQDFVLDPCMWLQLDRGFGWEKETPLSSTGTVQEFRVRQSRVKSNLADNVELLNELGYTALSLFHSAVGGFLGERKRLEREIQGLTEQSDGLEQTREVWENTNQRAMNNMQIQVIKNEIRKRERIWLATACESLFVLFFLFCFFFFLKKKPCEKKVNLKILSFSLVKLGS
jgi:hypothetical protein